MVNVIIDPGSITDVGAGSSVACAVLVGSIVAVAMTVAVGSAELRCTASGDDMAVAVDIAATGVSVISVAASVPGSRSLDRSDSHAARPATISSRTVQVRSHPPLTKH
jgi:hypothetical protein